MVLKLFAFLSVIFASGTSIDTLVSQVDTGDIKAFKRTLVEVSPTELKRLLERVLAESNSEFLKTTLKKNKKAAQILKDNPDLIAASITEAGSVDNLKEVHKILELDSVKLSDGKNILQVAVDGGSVQQIKFISDLYPKMVNSLDANLESAVSTAARRGNVDVMKQVLKIPQAKLNLKNKEGKTPAEIAKSEGFTQTAALIIEAIKQQKK